MGCWKSALTAHELVLPTLSRHPARSSKAVIQPGCKSKAKESNGLEVLPATTLRTPAARWPACPENARFPLAHLSMDAANRAI